LAKKILDLKQYGSVNRGVLELHSSPSDEERYFKQQGIALGTVNGVYITSVMSKAQQLKPVLKKAILYSIDGTQLASSTEFSERIKTST
jgi:hypothetical protein